VATLAIGRVDGIPVTEYRATVSLVKLYDGGPQNVDGVLGEVFLFANPSPQSPILTLPVEIWTNAAGQILKASASDKRQLASGAFTSAGMPTTKSASARATITLSGFGVAVRASTAPPANEVTYQAIPVPTEVSGTVSIRGGGGKESPERGLLILTYHVLRDGAQTSRGQGVTTIGAVGAGGRYTAGVLGGHVQVSATFYSDDMTVLSCVSSGPDRFDARSTTKGVNFVCGK
jgi:hypothetical protein